MSQELKPTVGRESDKFMLRFPDGMRERIAELAKQSGRSMNAEIIARLEASFEADSSKVISTNFDELLTATVREAIESVLTPEAIDAVFKPKPMQFVVENADGTITVYEPKFATKTLEPVVNISGTIPPDAPKRPARIVRRANPKKTSDN